MRRVPDSYSRRSHTISGKGSTINHLGGGRGAKRKKKIRSEMINGRPLNYIKSQIYAVYPPVTSTRTGPV